MKHIFSLYTFLIISTLLFVGCDFIDDFEADTAPSFYIDINENETLINAERNNTISIKLFAESGIDKVELRSDFKTVEGSQKAYNNEQSATYEYVINPFADRIGDYISYTVVLFDSKGKAITKEMQLQVQKAPSTVTILLPPTAPETVNYDDTISFSLPFSSPTPLSLIKVTLGDNVLLEKTTGFFTPESDIIEFYYDNFNILAPGENKTFDFNIMGIAPIENDELGRYDTALMVYSVYVTGPRVPQSTVSFDNITMGFQSFSGPSQFMDLETGNIYGYELEPYGADVSELIDFAVYRSSSNGLCITNTTDAAAAEFIYKAPTYGFADWQTLNKTGFVKSVGGAITVTDFNNATDDDLFYETYRTADLIADTYKKIAPNDIIVFKTVNDKYGAILFHSYVNQSTGTVSLSIKVQE